jgi:hypothetical protein
MGGQRKIYSKREAGCKRTKEGSRLNLPVHKKVKGIRVKGNINQKEW